MRTAYILVLVFVVLGLACQEAETDRAGQNAVNQNIVPAFEPKDISHKIGVLTIQKDEDSLCLIAKNADIPEGTPIHIISSIFFPPARIVSAKVEKKFEKSCDETSKDHDKQDSTFYYSVRLNEPPSEDSSLDFGLTIALIGLMTAPKIVGEDEASADIDGDGESEYFRHCGGYEGTHFTAWKGKPIEGTRIWHYFYYAGYDTEFTCKKKEIEILPGEEEDEK